MLSLMLPFVTACGEIIDQVTDLVSEFIGEDNNESNNNSNNEKNDGEANSDSKDGANQAKENGENNGVENEAGDVAGAIVVGDDLKISVFEKAKEAAKTVTNQEVYVSAHQVFDYGYFSMDSLSEFIVHVSYDPLVMYQYGFTMVDGERIESEMYVEGDDIYVYMDMFDTWINLGGLAAAFSDEETVESAEFQTAEEQLSAIENSLEYFTLEETGTSYVFRLDAQGPEADAVYKKLLQGHSGNLEEMLEGDQTLDEAVIKSFEYVISFDKKSYHADYYEIEFELGLVGEEEFKILHQANSNFVNINEMGPVTVPDEVKESSGFPW